MTKEPTRYVVVWTTPHGHEMWDNNIQYESMIEALVDAGVTARLVYPYSRREYKYKAEPWPYQPKHEEN